jgi:hypothetical protein
MASGMDDPFTTPKTVREQSALDFDSPPILTRPATSPEQLKRTLQAHLMETRKRLDGAGQLGRDLVKQEEEIEARLKEVEQSGGKINPELKRKLAELEKEYNEVGRETARALLTNKIMGGASPHGGPNVRSVPSLRNCDLRVAGPRDRSLRIRWLTCGIAHFEPARASEPRVSFTDKTQRPHIS